MLMRLLNKSSVLGCSNRQMDGIFFRGKKEEDVYVLN